ncbi:MAG TPA: HTH domain-containing protein [Gemmatimonadaceae bacterium]|nr:HTH domain-containing protein [Gemmatimonadaceae bacterium]
MSARDGKSPSLRQLRRDQRRQLVRDLLPQHLSARKMAQALGCTQRTIERDIAAVRRQLQAEIAVSSVLDIAAKIVASTEAIDRTLWSIVADRTASPQARVAGAAVLIKNRDSWVRGLQSLGITFKAPERIQVQVTLWDKIMGLSPEESEHLFALTKEPEQFWPAAAKLMGPEFVANWRPQLTSGAEDMVVDVGEVGDA